MHGVGFDGCRSDIILVQRRHRSPFRIRFRLEVVILRKDRSGWLARQQDRVVVRRVAAIGEQQPLAGFRAQVLGHAGNRMAHVIADGAAAEGQAAEHGDRLVERPAEHPPCELRHAGKAAVEFDSVISVQFDKVQFQRAAKRDFEAGRGMVVRASQDIGAFMRCRSVPDIDGAIRNPAALREGERGHDEASALVHAGIRHLHLGVGVGDPAVVRCRRDNSFGLDRLLQPGVSVAGRDLAHAGPQRAALGLSFGERLTKMRAQGVLV